MWQNNIFLFSVIICSIFVLGCPTDQPPDEGQPTPTPETQPTSTPVTVITENLITNGDFSDGEAEWIFYKNPDTNAVNSQFDASNNDARITAAISANIWDIILYQKVNIQINKHYILGFDYSSTIDTQFYYQIQHDGNNDDDWTTHFFSTIFDSLYNRTWPCINNFEMTIEDDLTDFKINFGTSTDGAEIIIDNIFVIEMSDEGDFLEEDYWVILKEDDGLETRLTPYDYLKTTADIDSDGEHESYIVIAYIRIMNNMMRVYYKFEFIDPGNPAGSTITDLYPDQFVYNSDEDIPYSRTDNSFTLDSPYFEDGDFFWSNLDTYMLTVSVYTTYIYQRTSAAAVTDAVDDPSFVPPYID